ncbi:MAG: transcriptional regulator [Actinophytocola sp.]|nr:transcriptional regulator [Actinophytocola sp.]MPZ80881.1 transcriptional regulator [Actinophytocola sp.]
MRLSNDAFARRLGIGLRTVAGWHQKPTLRPQSAMQEILDTALEQASPAVQARFAELTADSAPDQGSATVEAEGRLSADPNITAALHWLDQHAGWEPGTARRDVAARLSRIDPRQLQDRGSRRGRVDQRRVADALGDYYRDRTGGYGQYAAAGVVTSVLTHADRLDLDCELMPPSDRLTVTNTTADREIALDEETAGHAAQRLAETLALNIRLVDGPLFRLVDIEPRRGAIRGTFDVTRFVRYALTMDLLEGELIDALAADVPVSPETLPLRHTHLPDLASVLDLPGRLCAGGALALCAIARPASPLRGPADYVLLVQERSGHVVNAARRLAVIPKGFHEPMTDYRADAHLSATLRREMEEELFGREDIDSTNGDQRRADPMHPSRLSEPMQWLTAEPDRLRMECTGFGLNLMSGNFEFASLIVIDDEEFWSRFGGQIEANWETTSLRQYSSLDRDMLSELISDNAWSNEGLFALLQGLRSLSRVGGSRVDTPTVEWEIR